ncbi:CYP722 protein [Hibiscus syriacus]|uniref:CYP722 protein n=1 Tax=Hibiscus syriacus TaxID=106335 RepID=A0A6A2X6K8_HIBSY|nr:uncharacterized protein LOC120198428 [Hibiscus syriacus]KAE8654019.1 CYP722 protein [Hibiscus syriacus]
MDSFEFDNVKAEKEDALWRYNMEKKLRSGFQFIGFLLVFLFISWSWFPTLIPDIVRVAGDLRLRFDNTLNEPLPIFIILNIIILIVCVLSSQKQTQKQSDIYEEYVDSRQSIMPASAVEDDTTVDRQIVAAENAVAVTTGAEETTAEKQIVLVENAVAVAETKRSLSPRKRQQQQQQPSTMSLALTVTKPKPVITSTEKANRKEYGRTRSVLSESGNRRPRWQFKKSEMAMMGRELMVSTTEPSRKSLDEMSNDEFRLIVDSFIAERRKILIQENCMSIVVKN